MIGCVALPQSDEVESDATQQVQQTFLPAVVKNVDSVTIEDIVTQVNLYYENGQIYGNANGIVNSLIVKLEGAIDARDRGQPDVACNKLNAFTNEVEAKQDKQPNGIESGAADNLIDMAQQACENISATATPMVEHTPTAIVELTETPTLELTPIQTATSSPTPIALPTLTPYPTLPPFSGMRILYSNREDPGYRTISVQGTDEIRIPSWPPEEAGGLSNEFYVSPNGNRLLYTLWSNMNQRIASIWTINPDGTDKQQLVSATDEWYPEDAIWSPDGKQIAYQKAYLLGEDAYDIGAPVDTVELWVMDRNGTNPIKVLDNPVFYNVDGAGGQAFVFRWLRNGYIYFVTHSKQMYAVNPQDGSFYLLMKNVDALYMGNALAPDGKHVLVRDDITVEVIEQAGMTPVEISGSSVFWSANGQKFSYRVKPSGSKTAGIWEHDHITHEEKLLLPSTSFYSEKVYGLSPDGQYLAYKTDEGLFIRDIENNQDTLIVSKGRFIRWIPVP